MYEFFVIGLLSSIYTVLDCGEPSDLVNGKVSVPHTTICGSEVTYSCNVGYSMKGVSSRTCETNEQWSTGTILCERRFYQLKFM